MTQSYPTPPPAGSYTPAWVRSQSTFGGVSGDDTDTSTALLVTDIGGSNGPNTATDYTPRTQAQKAAQTNVQSIGGDGTVYSTGQTVPDDVGRRRGWIEPGQPYTAKPASPAGDPTITSLTPNTAVHGGANVMVTIAGTNFTPWSDVFVGGSTERYRYARYINATTINIMMDVQRSVAGTATVVVMDHGVKSAPSTFTFT